MVSSSGKRADYQKSLWAMTRSISHHIPQRTCVACRMAKPKRELIRLVRISDGSVEVDASGKKVGRGAYLCRSEECWEIGLKGSRLEHVLRVTLTQDNRAGLIGYGQALMQGVK